MQYALALTLQAAALLPTAATLPDQAVVHAFALTVEHQAALPAATLAVQALLAHTVVVASALAAQPAQVAVASAAAVAAVAPAVAVAAVQDLANEEWNEYAAEYRPEGAESQQPRVTPWVKSHSGAYAL